MLNEIILEMKGIYKYFRGVTALNDVSLTVHKAEILALVGENGAGKSTLMNILLGALQPDGGEILFKGRKFLPGSPAAALNAGISMIHQELTLVPDMSVSENIWLGREQLFTKRGYLNISARDKATNELLSQLKINVDPAMPIKMLSVAQMQLVELARAVSYNSELIIMDEPTSSLTSSEISVLYDIVHSLSAKGTSIIFITHKLEGVFAICNTVTILRDGHFVDSKPIEALTKDEIIAKMVGRRVENLYPKEYADIGEVALEVKNFTREGCFSDVSFSVRKGEVLGFCGLIGAGRTELVESIFGIEKKTSGTLYLGGKETVIKSTKDAIAHGMAMVTEDRLRRGLIHKLSVKFNMSVAYLDRVCRFGFANDTQIEKDCASMREALAIKVSSLNQLGGQLSGGNQQKVIIGKWMMTEPEILILDEPTRGIDVGAKAEIYRLICKLAQEGKAIIMVSSELPELMGISDRIIVMANGHQMGEFEREHFDSSSIMQAAFGKRQ